MRAIIADEWRLESGARQGRSESLEPSRAPRSTNPRRCLAPDVFVKLGVDSSLFGTWKSWLHGAPDLAVEIVSPSGGEDLEWDEKLARYGELGVAELVRFDPEVAAGGRLRVWDRMEEDLVEREVLGDTTPCLVLGWTWTSRGIRCGLSSRLSPPMFLS